MSYTLHLPDEETKQMVEAALLILRQTPEEQGSAHGAILKARRFKRRWHACLNLAGNLLFIILAFALAVSRHEFWFYVASLFSACVFGAALAQFPFQWNGIRAYDFRPCCGTGTLHQPDNQDGSSR